MTKKHFKHFADIIRADMTETARRFPDQLERTRIACTYAAETFARVASEDNERFDRDRFMKACGLR